MEGATYKDNKGDTQPPMNTVFNPAELDEKVLLKNKCTAVVDPRGHKGCAPPGVQILSISCSFGKFWQNCMLVPP